MNTSMRNLFFSTAMAMFFSLTLVTLAQEPTPPSAATEADKTAPAAAPSSAEPAHAPIEPVPPAKSPTPSTDTGDDEGDETHFAPAAPQPRPADVQAPASPPQRETPVRQIRRPVGRHRSENEIVEIGDNAVLAAGKQAKVLISVFGSATNEGDVSRSVLSVFGNTRSTGTVGQAAFSVFGNTYVSGEVAKTAGSVFGNVAVNGNVGGSVVSVFGEIKLGPRAEVNDVISVLGSVKRDPQAVVHGTVRRFTVGDIFADGEWLHSWFLNCLRYARLLAFAPHLMWAWWIALSFLALYVLLALMFGRGVEKCVETLEERPGFSLLTALLTVLLAPVVFMLLLFTGVGIAAIPLLASGLFVAGIFGKVVMLAWLGRRILHVVNLNSVALAVCVGGVLVLLMYTVPLLSIIVYKLFGWVGLGAVVYTLALKIKRERAAPPLVTPAGPVAGFDPVSGATVVSPVPTLPPRIEVAATLPRAGFWIRLAALLLDAVIVGLIFAILGSGKVQILGLAAYGAVMWKLRGSTIGGIICGLKVVRLDDRELDWPTSIVRTLGCFLSLAVMGLGFIWVAFDDEQQSWHDKIAGTTVVRVPKGTSLV